MDQLVVRNQKPVPVIPAEWVVPTDGIKGPGARRIVSGGGMMWYTRDHYKTFILIYP